MASSSSRSGRNDDVDIESIPPVLRMRLGHDATLGLLELFDLSHKEVRETVILACTERYERRLIEEASGLRVQVSQYDSSIRQDMAQLRADLRQDMAQLRADLRQEIAQLGADLRREMGEMQIRLREEMATSRVELFKWCFLFWIGQVLAIGGMMGVLLRIMR